PGELGGDVARDRLDGRRVSGEDAAEEVGGGLPLERELSSPRLEEGDAQAEEIGARVDVRLARSLLRGDVVGGAVDPAALPRLLLGRRVVRRAYAEVEETNLELSVGRAVEEHMLGLDVAMDVADEMDRVEDRRES